MDESLPPIDPTATYGIGEAARPAGRSYEAAAKANAPNRETVPTDGTTFL
jgi:hypothetical protein